MIASAFILTLIWGILNQIVALSAEEKTAGHVFAFCAGVALVIYSIIGLVYYV